MLKRIKRLRSYSEHARYMAHVSRKPIGVIDRQEDIPSPYAYSAEWSVWKHDDGKAVIVRETAHRQYDVFEVPQEMIRAGGA